MHVERISAETAAEASRIYVFAWQAGYRGIIPQPYLDALSPEQWRPRLETSIYKDFLLTDRGKAVATSSISPARDVNMQGWGEIISLYVLPEHFRKGYGKFLFSYDIQQLRADGFQDLYLWVLAENHRARKFYTSMGFLPNGDTVTLNIGGKDLLEMRYVNRL
jgi:GNAT superfamily N-acetyltransferase